MDDKIIQFSDEISANIEKYLPETGSKSQAFTLYALNEMSLKANLGEFHECYNVIRDRQDNNLGQINGYAISLNGEKVSLFYTIFEQEEAGRVKSLSAEVCKKAFTRMQGFYNKAFKAYHVEIDPSNPVYDICEYIANHSMHKEEDKKNSRKRKDGTEDTIITTVQLILLSNASAPRFTMPPIKIQGDDKNINSFIWDINQLYTNIYSDSDHLSIDIDLKNDEKFKETELPYIEVESSDKTYSTYMVIVPGGFLYDIYCKHNIDLLQNNLRYFKGMNKSNKGIVETLKNNPQRFLAYNNGLTATASQIRLKPNDPNSRLGVIEYISDLQILNGGQTIASIHHAKKKYPEVDLGPVFVQMKLILINEKRDELLPLITKFSNTQTRVSESDFTSNSAFNVAIYNLSRQISAPDPHGMGNITLWYFNKFSKQYEKERENTPVDSRPTFDKRNPANQTFTKEELAKVHEAWNYHPWNTAKGPQKSVSGFSEYSNKITPDRIFYEDTIALIILYRYMNETSEVFKSFKDSRSQIIPYTISYLKYITNEELSLYKIWNAQSLSDSLKTFIDDIGKQLKKILDDKTPEGKFLRSYCTREKTWDEIKDIQLNLKLIDTIRNDRKDTDEDKLRQEENKKKTTKDDYKYVISYGPKFWSGLYKTDNILSDPEKGVIEEIINAYLGARMLTNKQVSAGLKAIDKFIQSGRSLEEITALGHIEKDTLSIDDVDMHFRIMKIDAQTYKDILYLLSEQIKPSKYDLKIFKDVFEKVQSKKGSIRIKDYQTTCNLLDEIKRRFKAKYPNL